MKEINVKLQELTVLQTELEGLSTKEENSEKQIVIIRGLINEKIPLSRKYWLNNLLKQVKEELASVESLRNDMIKKFGVEDADGNVSIPIYVAGTEVKDANGNVTHGDINPKFEEFQKEYVSLLNEVKTFSINPIPISVLDSVESEYPYTYTLENLVEVEVAE